jgi:hypothetical protein
MPHRLAIHLPALLGLVLLAIALAALAPPAL